MSQASIIKGPNIGPSLMCADQGNLRQAVIELASAGVDFFHIDVMDGNFVPNFAMSPDTIRALRQVTELPFDVHLMLSDPSRYLDRFIGAGADSITIHAEATRDLGEILKRIHELGGKAGVAINPGTPVSILEPVLPDLDLVCVMAVEPGFSGQKFIESVLPKIPMLKELISQVPNPVRIQVDGNVSYERIPQLLRLGATELVCGTSALFRPSSTLSEDVSRLRAFIESLDAASI